MRLRRRLLLGVILNAATLLGVTVLAGAAPASAGPPGGSLAAARAASAAFHDPAAALAAGYLPTEDCVAVPGLGTMGQHWVKPSLFTTKRSDLSVTRPQALLYVPTGEGLRLVAVEYLVFAPGQQPAADPTQVDLNGPTLFGQHFNGLMPGHSPAMPVHWDLHVWLWAHNPAGVFAQFNPSAAISC